MPELLPYQRKGVNYLKRAKTTFLADDPGCGKTAQAIMAVKEEGAYPALVVCPSYLRANWVREIKMWDPAEGKWDQPLNYSPGDNPALIHCHRWVVLSYESMCKEWTTIKICMKPKTVVFDEAHYLKNLEAERTKRALEIVTPAEYRFMLTGTPVLNRPEELWAQLRVLGVHQRFLTGTWEGFSDFFIGTESLGPAKHATRMETLGGMARYHDAFLRRTKEEVLPELPPSRRCFLPVDLDDRARYEAEASNASLKGLERVDRLRYLSAMEKLPQVYEWVDNFLETGKKLVVFAYHVDVAEAIARNYGVKAVTGKLSAGSRQGFVDNFQKGEAQIIVFSLHAGQLGYTLTAASDVLFVQGDWVPAMLDQAAARCHRLGQTQPVTEWHMIAKGTVEEEMLALLDRKELAVSGITDGNAQVGTGVAEYLGSLVS